MTVMTAPTQPKVRVGDWVIFQRSFLAPTTGKVERVGDKTASVREDNNGFLHRKIWLDEVYPTTPENLQILLKLGTVRKLLEEVAEPLHKQRDELLEKLQATRVLNSRFDNEYAEDGVRTGAEDD